MVSGWRRNGGKRHYHRRCGRLGAVRPAGDTRTAIDSGLLRVVDETQGHYAADSEQFDGVSYIIATAGDNGMYWGVTGDYDYYERLD